LLNLPEFTKSLIDPEAVLKACGPTLKVLDSPQDRIAAMAAGEAVEEEELEEFYSVSWDSPTAISAYLLGIDGDDPEAYQQPIQELILAMATSGADPLAQVIAKRSDSATSKTLLAGLSPETAKQAACAWAANLEYEAPAEAEFGGWYGDGTEIRYKPGGHADPVVKAWLEFAIAAAAGAEDEDDRSRAEAMRNQLLSVSDGPGGCIKCHAVSAPSPTDGQNAAADVMLNIEWTRPGATDRFYTRFAHKPHITLLGPGAGCRACHKLDETADYGKSFKTWDASAFVSNFKAIGIGTCTTCHAKGQVREDCQLCHLYHLEPAFKKGML